MVATERGRSWIVGGRFQRSTTWPGRRSRARRASPSWCRRPAAAARPTPPRCLARGRVLPPIDHPDPAHLLVTGTGLTHLGSAATRDSMHAKAANGDEADADRFHEDVPHGARGRQAGQGRDRRAAGVVLQGRRQLRGGAGQAAHLARLRRGRRRGAGGRRHLSWSASDGTPWRIGFALVNEFSDHVMERQQLSLSRPFQAAAVLLRARDAARRPARRRARHVAHPPRRQGDLREAVPHRRGEHVAHHRQSRAPPFQVSVFPPARRRPRPLLRHRDAVVCRRHPRPRRATSSRSRRRRSACRLPIRSRSAKTSG